MVINTSSVWLASQQNIWIKPSPTAHSQPKTRVRAIIFQTSLSLVSFPVYKTYTVLEDIRQKSLFTHTGPQRVIYNINKNSGRRLSAFSISRSPVWHSMKFVRYAALAPSLGWTKDHRASLTPLPGPQTRDKRSHVMNAAFHLIEDNFSTKQNKTKIKLHTKQK